MKKPFRSKRKPKKEKKAEILCRSGLYQARTHIIRFLMFLVFAAVLVRCFQYMIIESESIKTVAYGQWESVTSLQAARGKILDRNGVVLAANVDTYKVLIYPESIKDDDKERVTDELVEILGVDREKTYKMVCNTYIGTKKEDKRQSFLLVRQVDEDKARAIMQLNIKGVGVETDVGRQYPYNSLLSSIIGTTDVDCKGRTGLEYSEEKYLAGKNGTTVVDKTITNAAIPFGDQAVRESVDGNDITLTIDVKIQSFLESALSEALTVNNAVRAEGIIMNAKTGEIVALSTKPDFDLNNPPLNDGDLFNELSRNRIVADSYEPGSTFKIVTLASAIECGAVDSHYSCTCNGAVMLGSERIKCWKSGGHGTQNLTQCAENSCNCAFVDMALKMQKETFYDYIYKFGFGESTGSGLTSEASGIVSSRIKVQNSDLARIGFGQSISVTPIQLVTAVSAAVNGGTLMQPYIVDTITSADGKVIQDNEPIKVRTVISARTSKTVREILKSVVDNGSGKNARIAGYSIGGKTGTAQKYGKDGKIAQGKLIASFVGIAPINDPKYVCLILVDEPNVSTIFGSTVAAPWVKQVLENTLEYDGFKRETGAETVKVPDVCGLDVKAAIAKLAEFGLTADYQATDKVINQVPEANTVVEKGTGVLLYTENTVAKPDVDRVEVPKLIGMEKSEAYAVLKRLGLVAEDGNEYKGGRVKSQYPYYGTEVDVGSSVTLKYE